MQLTITKTATLGQAPTFQAIVDGKEYSFTYNLSQKLTNTTGEGGQGIFDPSDWEVSFHRDDATVTVDLPRFTVADKTAQEVLEDIVHRRNLVVSAFASKYPACNETATITLD